MLRKAIFWAIAFSPLVYWTAGTIWFGLSLKVVFVPPKSGFCVGYGWIFSGTPPTVNFSPRSTAKPPWKPSIALKFIPHLQFVVALFLLYSLIFPMSEKIEKQMQDITLGITDAPISLPPGVYQEAAAANRLALVVCPLNPRKQNSRLLITQMPRLWGLENSVTGRIIAPGQIQFLFNSEEALNMVLRRSPWSFADWMVTVTRWYPNLSSESMKIIPFWVQIKGIPIEFLTRRAVEFIGDQIVTVFDIDYDDQSTRVDFVRIQLLWNVSNPLRFQRNFQFVLMECLDES